MSEIVPLKTVLVSKPNQYPSCWPHIYDDNETTDNVRINIPQFDVEMTRAMMEKTEKITASTKNNNSEEDDWEQKVMQYVHTWTLRQNNIFKKVAKILNNDRLARSTVQVLDPKPSDIVRMRAVIDKSAERMRKELAGVAWEVSLVQWLHTLLMENLPPSYLAAYLDIMQVLKNKVPSLVDKMIFWKPGNVEKELLATILKKPWQPSLQNKYRKLPTNSLIVVIPPIRGHPQPPRVQKLFTLFTTMSPILPIQLNAISPNQSLQSCAEQIISITRTKIQELKAENPDRRLLLIGMHSSASLALQVGLIEQVSGIVCFGFGYNTVHGVRGQPDDQILNTNCPVLLMIGQNAAKTNHEELEGLREKLNAQSIVQIAVVGGADDNLRVSKKKQRFEGVTQEMVDNMIVDEITEFATSCIQRPLIPNKIKTLSGVVMNREIDSSTQSRKRKGSDDAEIKKIIRVSKMKPTKIQMKAQPVSSSEMAVEMAVQSITGDNEPHTSTQYQRITTSDTIMTQQKVRQGPQKFFTHQQVVRQRNIITVPRQNQGDKKFLPMVQGHQTQTNFSPPKFTIVRQSNQPQSQSIYDMPVVYADSDGNVVEKSSSEVISIPSDSSAHSSPSPSPSIMQAKKIILKTTNISQASTSGVPVTLARKQNVVLQKPSMNNKMVILNNLVGRPISAANIIVPQGSAQTIPGGLKIQRNIITTVAPSSELIIRPTTSTAASTSTGGRKIEILNNTLIKPAMNTRPPMQVSVSKPVTFVNLSDAKPLTNKISISSLPPNFKSGQIIVKTSNLKPITITGTKQFGNLTVSKLNITAPNLTQANIVKKNP